MYLHMVQPMCLAESGPALPFLGACALGRCSVKLSLGDIKWRGDSPAFLIKAEGTQATDLLCKLQAFP